MLVGQRSSRSHVSKFCGRFRLMRSVFRALIFSVFESYWNFNFISLLQHPFSIQNSLVFWDILSQYFTVFCLAKVH